MATADHQWAQFDAPIVMHGNLALSAVHRDSSGRVRRRVCSTDRFSRRREGEIDALAAAPIPEPETYALFGAGLGVLAFVARRQRRRN